MSLFARDNLKTSEIQYRRKKFYQFIQLVRTEKQGMGFPGGWEIKNLPAVQEMQVQTLGREDPTPVFLPGQAHGQRSLAGYSLKGHKG